MATARSGDAAPPPGAPAGEALPVVFSPEFMADPESQIARLRQLDPVHYVRNLRMWFVTRHDDVKALLSDTDNVTSDRRAWAFYRPPTEGSYMRWVADHGLLSLDRAEHLRVRRLVSAAFTPRAIARMEDQIGDVVRAFAAPLRGRQGVVDVMAEFTDPIPNTVISRITGVTPTTDNEERFRRLAQLVVASVVPFASQDTVRRAESAMAELGAWVHDMAAERLEHPCDDLISDVVSKTDMGDQMTNDEIVALVVSLISAGSETTALGGVMAVKLLLEHPDVFAWLKADRSLIPKAVLEIIRHGVGGPSGMTRYALRDFELRGKKIRSGQMILLSVSGANHDPEVFDDPGTFDIERDNTELMAFGFGPHYCLGAQLAKAELLAMVDAMCDFLPLEASIRHDLIETKPFGMFERPATLPVAFSR